MDKNIGFFFPGRPRQSLWSDKCYGRYSRLLPRRVLFDNWKQFDVVFKPWSVHLVLPPRHSHANFATHEDQSTNDWRCLWGVRPNEWSFAECAALQTMSSAWELLVESSTMCGWNLRVMVCKYTHTWSRSQHTWYMAMPANIKSTRGIMCTFTMI